ncbi:phosphatase PAP2 family protein [Chitinophaga silvatica]|uniref:Phosphatase PAP2 family protein n=2 Tax=Chitinophaga silvatica TaxID=2282649 RepID=A0A3E1Y3A6_9BACT|nr:phosphatase PAP2 family protein [Chitinophaga silvatica]
MIGYGFYALNNPTLQQVNSHTKGWFKEIPNNTDFRPRTKIDNYLQYAPVVAVYALNMAGIKGKHNLRDRTILLGLSALITTGTVIGVKNLSNEQRPNQQDYLSFPSGHTATAFAAAEFMWQEYKDESPWIGMTGYIAAATTGALRMYNNKHWLSDVVAGAGFGILSTKAAYWAYPWIQRKLFKSTGDQARTSKIIMPSYNPQFKSVGLTLTLLPGNK